MRHPVVAALVLAFVALSSAPRDAEAQLIRFGVGGGPSFPSGDLSDDLNPGFHAQGMLALRVPLLPISARGDLVFQRNSIKEGGHMQQFAGVVNGFYTLLPLPVVSPYLSAGVGLYNTSFGNGSSTDVGINGGVGVRLNLFVVETFAEARYHRVLAGDGSPATIPITVGVMF